MPAGVSTGAGKRGASCGQDVWGTWQGPTPTPTRRTCCAYGYTTMCNRPMLNTTPLAGKVDYCCRHHQRVQTGAKT
eukprot:359833-Chlamydomonas_euryale.AAC.23